MLKKISCMIIMVAVFISSTGFVSVPDEDKMNKVIVSTSSTTEHLKINVNSNVQLILEEGDVSEINAIFYSGDYSIQSAAEGNELTIDIKRIKNTYNSIILRLPNNIEYKSIDVQLENAGTTVQNVNSKLDMTAIKSSAITVYVTDDNVNALNFNCNNSAITIDGDSLKNSINLETTRGAASIRLKRTPSDINFSIKNTNGGTMILPTGWTSEHKIGEGKTNVSINNGGTFSFKIQN